MYSSLLQNARFMHETYNLGLITQPQYVVGIVIISIG